MNLNDPLETISKKRASSADVERHCDYLHSPKNVLDTWVGESNLFYGELRSCINGLRLGSFNDTTIDEIAVSLTSQVKRRQNLVPRINDFSERLSACEKWGRNVATLMRGLEGRVDAKVAEVRAAKRAYQDLALVDGIPIIGGIEESVSEPVRIARAKHIILESELRELCKQHWAHAELWNERLSRVLLNKDIPELAPITKGKDAWPSGWTLEDISIGGQLWTSRESITPEDVLQTSVGDCYFAAAIAGLAKTPEGRALIQSLITDNGDGTYTVVFPGIPGSFTVDADVYTTSNGAYLTSGPGADGDYWYAILQKAYAQHRNSDGFGSDGSGWSDTAGGKANAVFGALGLGNNNLSMESADLASIQSILSKAPDFPATVNANFVAFEGGTLEGSHAYTVLAYFEGPPAKVLLRNPWGYTTPPMRNGAEDMGNGTFVVPVESIQKNANDISYSGKSP